MYAKEQIIILGGIHETWFMSAEPLLIILFLMVSVSLIYYALHSPYVII